MFKASIRTTVTHDLDEIIKNLEELDNAEVSAGYYDSQEHPEHDLTVPEIATINNYGFFNVPRRPFMSDAGQDNIKKTTEYIGEAIVDAIQNKPVDDDLQRAADNLKQNIQARILTNDYEENKEPYKSFKQEVYGHTKPLIATGYMKDNVNTRVKKGG